MAGLAWPRRRAPAALCAALIVVILAAAVELFSIYNGASVPVELAFPLIPLMAALIFYRRLGSRAAAWLLLAVLSYATAGSLALLYLLT